jgi:hypothetical protein
VRIPKSWKRPKLSTYLKKKQEENAQKEVKIAKKKLYFALCHDPKVKKMETQIFKLTLKEMFLLWAYNEWTDECVNMPP